MTIQEYSGFIKYKDAEGNIKVLLPITTIDNINGIDDIYASIGQSIKYIPQTLTEEEKAQVRENIGVSSGYGMPPVTDADNDKLLMVQNGQWVTIPSSWFVKNKISITSFRVTPNQAELGDTVDSVKLEWAVNMPLVAQTLNGEDLPNDIRDKSITPDQPYASTTRWIVKVTDEQNETASATATLSFLNGVYYGVAAIPETIDSAFILGLSKPVLRSSHMSGFTVTVTEGQYIWYAQPKQFGTCKFVVGGFEGGFSLVDTFEFTNGKGYTNPNGYYVYRSDEIVPGTTEVVIT